jgi:predicted nucleotidyltransferase
MKSRIPKALLPQRARDALLKAFPAADAAYLFGSVARGAARADSDIDLAILCAGRMPASDRFETERALSLELDADVDLIDLSSAPTVLQCEIIMQGTRLYQRDHDRVLDFEARVLSEYAVLLESTQSLREHMRDRLVLAK